MTTPKLTDEERTARNSTNFKGMAAEIIGLRDRLARTALKSGRRHRALRGANKALVVLQARVAHAEGYAEEAAKKMRDLELRLRAAERQAERVG